MCKCTPNIRTPFCGKGDCVWPHEKHKTGDRESTPHPDSTEGKVKTLDDYFPDAEEYLRIRNLDPNEQVTISQRLLIAISLLTTNLATTVHSQQQHMAELEDRLENLEKPPCPSTPHIHGTGMRPILHTPNQTSNGL